MVVAVCREVVGISEHSASTDQQYMYECTTAAAEVSLGVPVVSNSLVFSPLESNCELLG
jgi:hypothetical protein